MTNNMDGVCASKKSWMFQAYSYENMDTGMVRIGPCCKTREEASLHLSTYTGVGKAWVEQVPARFTWRD